MRVEVLFENRGGTSIRRKGDGAGCRRASHWSHIACRRREGNPCRQRHILRTHNIITGVVGDQANASVRRINRQRCLTIVRDRLHLDPLHQVRQLAHGHVEPGRRSVREGHGQPEQGGEREQPAGLALRDKQHQAGDGGDGQPPPDLLARVSRRGQQLGGGDDGDDGHDERCRQGHAVDECSGDAPLWPTHGDACRGCH